jgi:U3 small nucleolar RNA-associated protein 7
LKLDSFGPYKYLDYTRNVKYMVIASRKGHIALIEWKKKELVCEF